MLPRGVAKQRYTVLSFLATFRRYIRLGLLIFGIISPGALAEVIDSLRIPSARSAYDISYDYHIELLSLALTKVSPHGTAPLFEKKGQMAYGRALQELIKGEILDVYWLGTDRHKESALNAVKIPLERGLMGFRKFTIRRESKAQFDKIDSLDDLRKLVACQGTHWPDIKVLEAAGLSVMSSPVYENLFVQVNRRRCDYFPRGYHEGESELEQRKSIYPDLIHYQDIILHYPLTVYFFTSKKKLSLAKKIETGLMKAIEDGSFLRHMQTHPLTRHVFPVERWMHVKHYFHLHNPEIKNTNIVTNKKLWFQPVEPHEPVP